MTGSLIFALEAGRALQAGGPGDITIPSCSAILRNFNSVAGILTSWGSQAVRDAFDGVVAGATCYLLVILLGRAGYASWTRHAIGTMLVRDLALRTRD